MAKDKKDDFVEVQFPLFGIDLSDPYAGQRAGTTPEGVNVIGYEPTSGRLRGGQRPGLTKFLTDQLVGPIQHLNFVVSTDVNALAATITSPPPPPIIYGGAEPGNPGIEDPSTNNGPIQRNPPGRYVRDGGNGVTPNRNIPAASPPPPPPPGTNRFTFTVTINPRPTDPFSPYTETPDLDPAGGGKRLATIMQAGFLEDDYLPNNGSPQPSMGTFFTNYPDFQSGSARAGDVPQQWVTYWRTGTATGSGKQDGVYYNNRYANNTDLGELREDWQDLKASLGGDLRVLVVDRVFDLAVDMDAFMSPFSAGISAGELGTVTLAANNVPMFLSSVFGTATDVVDYVPVSFGTATQGSVEYAAAEAQVAAAIAAWELAHPP